MGAFDIDRRWPAVIRMMKPPIVAEDGNEAATAVVDVARLAERPLSHWCNPSRFLADGVERRQAFGQQLLAGIRFLASGPATK